MDATLIALALLLQSQHIERLETELYIDTLTQIGNRAAFEKALSAMWTQHQASGQDFALLYLDGNGIKSINDFFGHDVGDRCIQAIARCIRPYDQAFRLGGDEFAVLMTAQEADLPKIVQRIHQRLALGEKRLRSQLGPQAHLSTAIGWAMASTSADPMELRYNADMAMYQKKVHYRQQREANPPLFTQRFHGHIEPAAC